MNEPRKNYDKMKGIIINLDDKGTDNQSNIIRILSALLSTSESVEKRKEILENEFHIPMTKEIVEDMQNMYNFGDAIQERGEKIGREIGKAEDILCLIEKLNMNCEEAMDFLNIEKENRQMIALRVKKLMEDQKAG